MYCSNCGKSITSNSTFCMHCGAALSNTENKELEVPQKISDLEFVYDGPSKKIGLITHTWQRGFSVVFALQNAQDQLISSDGDVELRVENRCGSFKKTFKFQVKKDEFTNVWIQQSENSKREFFGYRFFYDKPDLVSFYRHMYELCTAHVEIWFTTPQKKRLYAKNWPD